MIRRAVVRLLKWIVRHPHVNLIVVAILSPLPLAFLALALAFAVSRSLL